MIRAVLFDLDDTLFDHRQAARQAINAVRASQAAFASVAEVALEEQHSLILEALHARVLTGEIGLDEARHERFRQLFAWASVEPQDVLIRAAVASYRERYLASWCEVPGALALLRALRPRARLGIVSNNLAREQHDKLRACGFDALVDAVVISEEAGVAKPDPAIFAIALERLGVREDEAVMIGDAWQADIVGAGAAGIRSVWFNPSGRPCPDPHAGVEEIRSLVPASAVLLTIFGAGAAAPGLGSAQREEREAPV